jgi:hypothetical protein
MTEPRTIPPMEADERATLTAFLDWQRATLALKCEGLTAALLTQPASGAATSARSAAVSATRSSAALPVTQLSRSAAG